MSSPAHACRYCGGSGEVPYCSVAMDLSWEQCDYCKGTGIMPDIMKDFLAKNFGRSVIVHKAPCTGLTGHLVGLIEGGHEDAGDDFDNIYIINVASVGSIELERKDWSFEDEVLKPTEDKNVNDLLTKFVARVEKGIDKYGMTTDRDDYSLRDWLQHQLEEMMDACVYLNRAIKKLDDETAEAKANRQTPGTGF